MPRIAIPFFLSLFALFSLPVSSPSEAMLQRVNDCPGNAVQYRGRSGATTCHCTARASRNGTVWGSETYTDDSRICRAAVHSGQITERGGDVRIVFLRGRNSYRGSRQNGVRSQNYGRWQGSFRFAQGNYGGRPGAGGGRVEDCPSNATQWRGRRGRQECQCDARATRNGSVWGTEVYTDDSRICRAAVHAGVIGNRGGVVTLDMRRGRSSYDGSRRNGVRSRNYGRWQGSFVFVGRGGNGSGGNPGGGGYVPPNASNPPQSNGRIENCPGYGFALRTQPGRLECRCTRTGVSAGQVIGTNVYSERSAVCRAALHAGAVTTRGGVVTIFPGGGQSSFRGSSRNGVSTQSAGRADYSFRFNR